MKTPPILFDRALHRARLQRAARQFNNTAFLKRRVARDVAERVALIMKRFDRAVDLGARDGAFARALDEIGARDQVDFLVETDLSAAMLAGRDTTAIVADEERLPFGPASVDLIVSSLALHWTNDLPGVLIQARKALRPEGVFIASMLGGSTLTELRQSLLQAETELSGGAGPRVSPFAGADDLASLLQRAGFRLPVADCERVTVRYRNPLRLLSDLRGMGETNVLTDRPRSPLGRAVLARALDIYVERFADSDGAALATFEVVTATGWASG